MDYHSLVHDVISVSTIHRYRISKSAQKVGLYYGQPVILEYILNNESCTQKDIADRLHISPASAATSLKRLEKAGLVTRSTDKTDTRKNRISLTENGISALKQFRVVCEKTDSEMFRGFSQEECQTLENYLKRLRENLEDGEISKEEIEKFMKKHSKENKEAKKC